ncbi:hypothetical protein C0993_003345, partial [Termitomyces sp. T159_Od127]
ELNNVVHQDEGPGAATNGEWFEKAIEAVVENFGSEAQLPSLDILGDVFLHTWPKVSLGDELKGLTDLGMSVKLVVVMLAEDVQADLLVVQSIDLSIPEKELVVRKEGEGAVVVGIVSGGVLGVVLSEEGVLGGIANLV